MKRFGLFAFFTLLLLAVIPALAQETFPCPVVVPPCPQDAVCEQPLPPRCPPFQPGVSTNPEWLRVDHHRVDVEIHNQLATTHVSLKFVNEGRGQAEGTFIFPLPSGAAVDQLTMLINGVAVQANILPADQARSVYNAIVRQYRDPALLEYVGSQAVQASIFPIPPGESREVDITYSQALEVDNGLVHYVYPLSVSHLTSPRTVDDASIHIQVDGSDVISNIYSPSHNIAISRSDDNRSFSAGFEASDYAPSQDFSLYYGIANSTINVNLLTYRESASDEGFFMLMVQPPITVDVAQRVAKDVIVVLDQSGSMQGDKWDQARAAAAYVLNHLNPEDRFNVILFSTGYRVYSNRLESPAQAADAINWIQNMDAGGGTDINLALTMALQMTDSERPTSILFMTDGLATEGVQDSNQILQNVKDAGKPNVGIFTFGVGDDVDTFLLDSIVMDHHGASSYVRPTERIDEEVASLYNKISAPVLNNISLDFGDVTVEDTYPNLTELPDLFAGTQLTIVGRYRGSANNVNITLHGNITGQDQTFVYGDQTFRERAGGEPIISRLWATRRIGELLNDIRLHGQNQELVNSVVSLSIRYGIITPYTSFLINENDILSQTGRQGAAEQMQGTASNLSADASGAAAVSAADSIGNMQSANAPAPMLAMPTATSGGGGGSTGGFAQGGGVPQSGVMSTEGEVPAGQEAQQNAIQAVNDKTFIQQNGVWTDTEFVPDTMTTQKVTFLSDDYFTLLDAHPELGPYFAIGDAVIVVLDGTPYEVTPDQGQ